VTLQVSVAPVLVFGWGNLSRGDDALGPLFVERLRTLVARLPGVAFLEDYQLQIEHALDLVGRKQVLFVDASLSARAPFEASSLSATPDQSFTTHALSPQALMQVFQEVQDEAPPPCTLLAIHGERFELGEPPTPQAIANLDAALIWAQDWVTRSIPASSPA
jgi:hydrogenase maturation protease